LKKKNKTCDNKIRQAVRKERAEMKRVIEVEKLKAVQRAIKGMRSCETDACRA
jgi:hypothetical protein